MKPPFHAALVLWAATFVAGRDVPNQAISSGFTINIGHIASLLTVAPLAFAMPAKEQDNTQDNANKNVFYGNNEEIAAFNEACDTPGLPRPYWKMSEAKPGWFAVTLEDNYTYEEHFKRIGKNLPAEAKGFRTNNYTNSYGAFLSEDLVHERIRMDPGVEHVSQEVPLRVPWYGKGKITSTAVFDSPSPESPGTDSRETEKGQNSNLLKWASNNNFAVSENHGNSIHALGSHEPRPWHTLMMVWGAKIMSPRSWYSREKWVEKGSGDGVLIYVLDTGVRLSHQDFGNRAVNLHNEGYSDNVGGQNIDVDGHGSHVAGIAAGIKGGLAPWATIVNVKVICDESEVCDERPYHVSRAIYEVVAEHRRYQRGQGRPRGWKGSVINMSFSIQYSRAIEQAIKTAYDAGIPMVAAAGNSKMDSKNAFPCAFSEVLCVGATNITYGFANVYGEDPRSPMGSNFGPVLDVLAPGDNVESVDISSDSAYILESGTSMASPAVAGAIAAWISREGPISSPPDAYTPVLNNSLSDIILDVPYNTPNLFLNVGKKREGGVEKLYEGGDTAPPFKAPDNWAKDREQIHENLKDKTVPQPFKDWHATPHYGLAPTLNCTYNEKVQVERRDLSVFINPWCNEIADQPITKKDQFKESFSVNPQGPGNRIIEQRFSANWIEDPVERNGRCEGNRIIREDDCRAAMWQVLDECAAHFGKKATSPRMGGSQQGKTDCVIYKIELKDLTSRDE